jgi:TetR/AcrR family transcriptional regulator, transcriptional repressor for nem operon
MKKSARSRILATAAEEIQLNGLAGAGLNRILRASGFSKGAFYHHFSSGDELIRALIDEVLTTRLTKDWIRPLERARNPITDFERIAQNTLASALNQNPSDMALFLQLIQDRAVLAKENQVLLDRLIQAWLHAVKRVLRSAYRKGSFISKIDEKSFAWLLLGAYQSAIQSSHVSSGTLLTRSILRSVFSLLNTTCVHVDTSNN